ncbi:MAG: phosphoribosylanthranilate isomerase [Bacteroidales bacterium]|nr:phosphoribosylanthranilate isomerase [Bacteroidales bacterium]
MNSLIVKVCGMTLTGNIKEVAESLPDYMGFIFFPGSPRYVGDDQFPDLPSDMPETIKKTGVFVNEREETVRAIVKRHNLQAVQLHGDESPEYCRNIKKEKITLIRAFRISGNTIPDVEPYSAICDLFLFDTSSAGYGGSGKKFNWEILKQYNGNTPFLISGGISPEDVEAIIGFSHKSFAGIDINSGFETSPGIKDATAVNNFINSIRNE